MRYNTLNCEEVKRRVLLHVAVVCLTFSCGCITIKDPNRELHTVLNCQRIGGDHANAFDMNQPCELYDRREVAKRWAKKLNPVQLIPPGAFDWVGNAKDRSSQWVSNQHGRCLEKCDAMKGWVDKKKREANPPPWPRFHPIPTQPAFESQQEPNTTVPENYGCFGPSE